MRANPTTITGTVRRHRGALVVDPLAVRTETGVVVLDPATDTPDPLPPGIATTDPLSAAVGSALTVLAEAAHRGLDHLPHSLLARVHEVAQALHTIGPRKAAEATTSFFEHPVAATWLRAYLRLLVTADAR